jgi:ATP-dependent DNA ligase
MTSLTTEPDALAAYPADALPMNAKAAKTVAEATGGKPSVMEPKFDGWRLIVHRAADGVRIFSRTGKRYDGRLPEIEAEVAERFPAGTWLDAEAVAIRVEGAKVYNDWGVAQSVLSSGRSGAAQRSKVTLMVFDLLAHGGIDARSLTFERRRYLLDKIFAEGGWSRVALTAQLEATEANHDLLVAQGFEGSMVKRLDATYASGARGWQQRKLKATATIDAVVMGFQAGRNGFSGMVGAVIFGQHDADGRLVERGRCSGMTMAVREDMTADPDAWLGSVIEIAHMGVNVGESESGRFRHPQYKRRRADKRADQVTVHDA